MTTTPTTPTTPYPPAAIARALTNANAPPSPAQDASRTAQKYAAMAQNFRNSAWQHLDAGDRPQASNKAWGLVA